MAVEHEWAALPKSGATAPAIDWRDPSKNVPLAGNPIVLIDPVRADAAPPANVDSPGCPICKNDATLSRDTSIKLNVI
jgi:hypothetical protein